MTDIRPESSRLAAELRLLRERSALSYAALAERTPYSKSAWQRYLTGKVLPPWSAVQTLCQLAGEPQSRLRALWELAESVTSGRSAVSDVEPAAPSAEPLPNEELPAAEPVASAEPATSVAPSAFVRKRRNRSLAVVLLCLSLVAASAALYIHPWDGSHRSSKPTLSEGSQVTCTSGSCDVTCKGAACNGLDPGITLCGVQPQTLQDLQTPSGIGLEIRYNPKCEAAWARIWHSQTGDTLTLTTSGEPAQTIRVSDGDGYTFTPMIYVANARAVLKACISSAGAAPRCYTTTAS